MTDREEFDAAWGARIGHHTNKLFDEMKALCFEFWQAGRSTPKQGEAADPHAPKAVFLQLYGDSSADEGPVDYEANEITWCWHRINDSDVRYVQAAAPSPSVEPVPAADDTQVICPACTHQFRAIPPQVQGLLLASGHEPPFLPPPLQQVEPGWRLLKDTTYSDRSWPGGTYMGTCCDCLRQFCGKKRQPTCRDCAAPKEPKP